MSEKYTRTGILEAADAACANRNSIYGNAGIQFQDVTHLWEVILGYPTITAEQVALCMIALKIVRAAYKPTHADSWIDMAGYAALGGEIADAREKKNQQ